jgi:hypothetical protein
LMPPISTTGLNIAMYRYKLKPMETLKKLLPVLIFMLPLAIYAQHKPTSYDSDGDGIPDSIDKCVLVPGVAQFNGCPFAPVVTADDRDGDGVPDALDACPDMFGLSSNHGCPDMSLINNTTGMTGAGQTDNDAPVTLFTSSSSSQQQQLTDFKDNLLAVLASSGHMFSDLRTNKDEHENDYKTALCLAGADECYIDLSQHFYATYGTYTDLEVAMDKYEGLKENLQMALSESLWSRAENVENGIKSFELRRKDGHNSFSPSVSAFVQQTPDNLYRVYLKISSR